MKENQTNKYFYKLHIQDFHFFTFCLLILSLQIQHIGTFGVDNFFSSTIFFLFVIMEKYIMLFFQLFVWLDWISIFFSSVCYIFFNFKFCLEEWTIAIILMWYIYRNSVYIYWNFLFFFSDFFFSSPFWHFLSYFVSLLFLHFFNKPCGILFE